VGWIYAVLLAAAVSVLVAAEWPRLAARTGADARLPRRPRRSKARERHLRLVQTDADRSESEEFAASVERDLERLPTIDERER
jgi:hypothetical protein